MAGERPLGELTENFDSIRVPVKEAERVPGPYPYYGASGIVDHVDKFLFDGEYLLIAEDGENLRTRNTPFAFMARGKFWVNNHAHIVRGNRDADTRFLMYALAATEISGYLTGSTMPKLTQGNMNRIPVVAPPLKEQQAIACILGSLDDKIELNRRMNRTLEGLARAIFQSWFVDFDPVRQKMQRQVAKTPRRKGDNPKNPLASSRPGGFAFPPHILDLFPDSFENSELGEIPKGWRVGTLGAYLTTQIGGDWGEDNSFDGAVEVVVLRGVDLEHLRSCGDAEPPRRWVKEASVVKRRMSPRDLLIASSGAGPCGRPLWVSPHWGAAFPFPVLYSNFCKRFQAETAAHAAYFDRVLFQMRQSGEIWEYINGTSLPNLDANGLLTGKLAVVPSQEILEKFAAFITPIYNRLYSRESRSLADLRDALLPKLISGELRVSDAERIVGRCV